MDRDWLSVTWWQNWPRVWVAWHLVRGCPLLSTPPCASPGDTTLPLRSPAHGRRHINRPGEWRDVIAPHLGAREMGQWLRVCTVFPEDLSWIPKHLHCVAHTAALEESDTLFWPLRASVPTCMHSHIDTHRNIIKNSILNTWSPVPLSFFHPGGAALGGVDPLGGG